MKDIWEYQNEGRDEIMFKDKKTQYCKAVIHPQINFFYCNSIIEDFQFDKIIITFEWRKGAETSLHNYEREEQAGHGVTHQKSRWTKNCIM